MTWPQLVMAAVLLWYVVADKRRSATSMLEEGRAKLAANPDPHLAALMAAVASVEKISNEHRRTMRAFYVLRIAWRVTKAAGIAAVLYAGGFW